MICSAKDTGENEKTSHRLGEDICKDIVGKGVLSKI
jgi:hypothetical protein